MKVTTDEIKPLWVCDNCGDLPYRPCRDTLIGRGCLCGGTYRRYALVLMDYDDAIQRVDAAKRKGE